MEKNNKKEKLGFEGTCIVNFTIGSKKKKQYLKGSTFKTENEKTFNALIKAKKIKQ